MELKRKRLSSFYYYFDETSNTHKLSSNYKITDEDEIIVSSFCPNHSFSSNDSISINGEKVVALRYNGASINNGFFFTINRDQENNTNFKGYIEFTYDVKHKLVMFQKMNIDRLNILEFKNTETDLVHVSEVYSKLIDFQFISYDSSDNATAIGTFDMTIHNNTVSSFLEFMIMNNDEQLKYYPKISFMNTDSTIGFHFLIPFNINKGGTNTISIYVKTPLPEVVFDIKSNDISCILKGINIFNLNEEGD